MYVLYIILGVFLVWVVYVYNSIVSLRNQVRNSFSGIDVQLKKRNDLIPNLVSVVKGYAAHEMAVFETVTRQRAQLMSSLDEGGDLKTQANLDNQIQGSLKSLFAVAENYPDLKANQNFLELQRQISLIEDQISASRRIYNANVVVFNTKLEVFPNNLLSKIFKFEGFDFFKADEKDKEVVRV